MSITNKLIYSYKYNNHYKYYSYLNKCDYTISNIINGINKNNY